MEGVGGRMPFNTTNILFQLEQPTVGGGEGVIGGV